MIFIKFENKLRIINSHLSNSLLTRRNVACRKYSKTPPSSTLYMMSFIARSWPKLVKYMVLENSSIVYLFMIPTYKHNNPFLHLEVKRYGFYMC